VGLDDTKSILANARVKALEAEAAKLLAEARSSELHNSYATIELLRKQEEEAKRVASDYHHRVYRFDDVVQTVSVKKCMEALAQWHRLDIAENQSPSHLSVVFSSPGGSVIDGFALFDFIQELRGSGHVITTKALGYAASMAGILLQAGDDRVMAAQSWLMIHEAAFGDIGKTSDIEDRVKWVKKIQDRTTDIFVSRMNSALDKREADGETLKRGQRLSKQTFQNRWLRKDWWLSSDDAYYHGLIDRIDNTMSV